MNFSKQFPLTKGIPILFLTFWFSVILTPLFGQCDNDNYSGLKDQRLKIVNDIGSTSSHMDPDVIGRVRMLKVRSECPKELKLVLHFDGYENAFIKVVILDHQRKPVKIVKSLSGSLKNLSSPIEMGFKIKPNAGPDARARSKYIQVTFSDMPGKRGPRTPYVIYELVKAWNNNPGNNSVANNQSGNQQTSGSNTIVRVTPNPIGSASGLNANMFKPLPMFTKEPTVSTEESSSEESDTQGDIEQEEIDANPYGPSTVKLSLWDDIVTDVDFQFGDISNISLDIYKDQNPNSHHYYFIPSSYKLKWTANSGYEISQAFGQVDIEGSGNVVTRAVLSSGISTQEVNLIRKIIEASIDNKHKIVLQPIPLDGPPEVSFDSELSSLYNISSDKITVSSFSDITKDFNFGFVADNASNEEIAVALKTGAGINGTMLLNPMGDSLADQSLSMHININHSETFGKFEVDRKNWRTQHWINHTPFPISLSYLHVLMMKSDGSSVVPTIYSWNLGNKKVGKGERVFFDAKSLPRWVDNSAYTQKMWLDYTVADCGKCSEDEVRKILVSVGAAPSQVSFELLGVLEQTGAKALQIKIRSHQGSVQGNTVTFLSPINAVSDDSYNSGPLYVPSGNDPSFEYQMTLVMEDGETYQSQKWIKSNQESVYIGMKNIREAIPSFQE